ncbi:MAG: nucleoside-diphosphate-sugar epimerase [Cognaticolwellia sp.]
MSETIFVSGASGRVGQPLVKALIDTGATVRVHARRAEAAATLKSMGAQVFDGDLGQLPSRAFDGVSTLYHLAGGVRGKGQDTPDRINRALTEALLERVPDSVQVVLASSGAVYGDRSNLWIEEDFEPSPNTRYGASKVASEALVLARGGKVVRLAAVYGAGFPFLMDERIRQGKAWLPGEGRNHIPTVHIDDAVRGFIAVAQRGQEQGIYHVADRAQPTTGAFFEAVHRQVGGTPVRFWSTYVPSYVQVYLAQQVERVASRTGQRPKVSPDALKLWTSSVRLRTERLKEELGFSWRYADHERGIAASTGREA